MKIGGSWIGDRGSGIGGSGIGDRGSWIGVGYRGTPYEHEERENKKLGANLALSVIPNSFLFLFFNFLFPISCARSTFSIPHSGFQFGKN